MASLFVGRILKVQNLPRRIPTCRKLSALVNALEEYPDIPTTTPAPAKASTASVSTLPNGVTVVTEDASSTTTVSLTFPTAGSSYESTSERGAALANKCMTFKSGSGISSILILRSIEDSGAVPFVTTNRESSTVGYTAAPDKAAFLLPLLATDCTFEKWDVRDAIKEANTQVAEANTNAQAVITEQIYAAAFGGQSPLGHQFFSAGASSPAIRSFRERCYVLQGATLAATGISDHETFVKVVEEAFSESQAVAPPPEAVDTAYLGGETRISSPSAGVAHVALSFPAAPSSAMTKVIKHCLSILGGDAQAFADSKLVGLYAAVDPVGGNGVVDALCSVITTPPPTDVIERAKGLAKAETLFALDGGSRRLAASMTDSVMESGTFSSGDLTASFDAITVQDVTAAFASMAKTKPSLSAVGSIDYIPYHGFIADRFG